MVVSRRRRAVTAAASARGSSSSSGALLAAVSQHSTAQGVVPLVESAVKSEGELAAALRQQAVSALTAAHLNAVRQAPEDEQ